MNRRRGDYLLQLPNDWTPEQALAVYDWLNELSAIIWRHYETPLMTLLESEPDRVNPVQRDLFEFDDPIAF